MSMSAFKYISFLKENRTREKAEDIYNQRISDARDVFDMFKSEFIERDCPICGSGNKNELPRFDWRYGVVLCEACQTMYVDPCPSFNALNYYYNECSCNIKLGTLLRSRAGKKGIILSERSALVLNLIEKMLLKRNSIKVLEIGCNSGAFLQEVNESLKKYQIDLVSLVGIDIDKNATDNPVSEEITLFHSSAEDFVKDRVEEFDLILHFKLIEHLFDPYTFMIAVRDLLKNNGATYFHTPNAIGMDNRALGYNDFRPLAHGIFPPMHLQAFTTQNILHFLLRAGLKLGEITTPGNFDVDIVKQFLLPEANSVFSDIHKLDEECLGVFQAWIKELGASSHLSVLAWK
uniref:Methyltransferase domain-containing protein n=1 Tax=Candidatus Kentrum sp. DK TaxID=2126562 RepID=A0A450T1Z8_9GAMM|nr:MAG: Methyltransferase domain-containing protein [Candidatus Kentron sp. DK]